MRLLALLSSVGLTVCVVGVVAARLTYEAPTWTGPLPHSTFFDAFDDQFKQEFGRETDRRRQFDKLFNYFLAGVLEYRTPDGSRVFHPGAHGVRGVPIEGLEGYARTMPLFAAWLRSGRPTLVDNPTKSGQRVNLVDLIRSGLTSGTDPKGVSYWGDPTDYDQRIVEASDIALTVWLTKPFIWDKLAEGEKKNVVRWLSLNAERRAHANNWLLMRAMIGEVLADLTGYDAASTRQSYKEFKNEYRGNGWFFDQPNGVDYYNAWSITYSLYWLDAINPNLDREFIDSIVSQSSALTSYLVSPEGIPIMGRSACYRMGVPTPIILNADAKPGLAARALDVTWRYFVSRGALDNGTVTQGYLTPDLAFLDNYTGPSSCLWSIRSLIAAYLYPADSPFWTDEPKALPVEAGDFQMDYPSLGWLVVGKQSNKEVKIVIPANSGKKPATESYDLPRQVLTFLLGRPARPSNHAVKYELPEYSNLRPAIP